MKTKKEKLKQENFSRRKKESQHRKIELQIKLMRETK